MSDGPKDQYDKEDAERRFTAALRGAREVGHKPMKDISPKRPKASEKRRPLKSPAPAR